MDLVVADYCAIEERSHGIDTGAWHGIADIEVHHELVNARQRGPFNADVDDWFACVDADDLRVGLLDVVELVHRSVVQRRLAFLRVLEAVLRPAAVVRPVLLIGAVFDALDAFAAEVLGAEVYCHGRDQPAIVAELLVAELEHRPRKDVAMGGDAIRQKRERSSTNALVVEGQGHGCITDALAGTVKRTHFRTQELANRAQVSHAWP
jgi:hypothetical protein